MQLRQPKNVVEVAQVFLQSVYTQTSKFIPPVWLRDVIKSGMNK